MEEANDVIIAYKAVRHGRGAHRAAPEQAKHIGGVAKALREIRLSMAGTFLKEKKRCHVLGQERNTSFCEP